MWKKRLHHEAGQAQPTFTQWVLHYALKLMRLLTLIIYVLTKAAVGDTEWRLIGWNTENWMYKRAWRMEYLSIFLLVSLAYFWLGEQHESLTRELFLNCVCKCRAMFPLWEVLCSWALTSFGFKYTCRLQVSLSLTDGPHLPRAWYRTGKNSIFSFMPKQTKEKGNTSRNQWLATVLLTAAFV